MTKSELTLESIMAIPNEEGENMARIHLLVDWLLRHFKVAPSISTQGEDYSQDKFYRVGKYDIHTYSLEGEVSFYSTTDIALNGDSREGPFLSSTYYFS